MSAQPQEMPSYREVLGSPDFERVGAEFSQFSKDSRYLSSIRSELRKESPDCWVAVYKEEVAAVGKTLKAVFSELASRGIPKTRVALDYITKEPMRLIL